ncbi:MAG: helix-turn-helix transcriptional regulator [Bacteriovoracaceae bacterium]|jgi:transcriptional regulator with XRE-family HTH domain|nr:helix-turn-helix transcriptional regulator [Bacteriovoracaceae bacterium]
MKKSDEFDKFFKKVVINIKKARMSKGLTQEDMLKFGFNYRHYQKLESGKHPLI